jgi:serine/threonine-protein kinase RsbW
VTSGAAAALSLTIDSRMACVGPLAERVRATCLELGMTAVAAGEVELSVVEAVNNAIEHAYELSESGRVEVTVARQGSRLHIEVHDGGRPMPAETLARVRVPRVDPTDTPSLPEGGMGLYVLTQLMDAVSYESRAGRNALIMERWIDRSEHPLSSAQPRRT